MAGRKARYAAAVAAGAGLAYVSLKLRLFGLLFDRPELKTAEEWRRISDTPGADQGITVAGDDLVFSNHWDGERSCLYRLDAATSLYVSTIGPVEKSVPTDIYTELLNTISERLTRLETTGYLLAYRGAGGSYNRTVTLDIADTIVEVEQVREPDRLCHRFVVPKATGVVLDAPDRTFEAAIDPRSADPG